MDPSCVAVAEGDRTVTTALLENRFDKICFTGSGYVGKIVAAAAAKQLTPCLLELGGKSPCIVDRSADLAHAAKRFVWGAFVNGGQTCAPPTPYPDPLLTPTTPNPSHIPTPTPTPTPNLTPDQVRAS